MSSLEQRPPRYSLSQIRKGMLGFTVAGTFRVGLRHILPGEAASGGAFARG